MSIWDAEAAYDSPEVAELVAKARGGAIESTPQLRDELKSALIDNQTDRDRLNLMIAQTVVNQGALPGPELLKLAAQVAELATSGSTEISDTHRLDAMSMAAGISAIVGDTRVCFDLCTRLAPHLSDDTATPLSERATINYAVTLLWLGAYELSANSFVGPLNAALNRREPEQVMIPALNLLVAISRHQIVNEPASGASAALMPEQREQLELVDAAMAFVAANASTQTSRDFAQASRAYCAVCCHDLDQAVEIWGGLDALSIHPAENFTSLLTIVEAHLAIHLGNYARALVVLDACLVDYETYDSLPMREIEALRLRGLVHGQLGNREQALTDTQEALRIALAAPGELPSLLMDELARRGEIEQSREALLERTTELTEQTLVDELTGLGNRRALDLHIAELRGNPAPDVAMLVIDIDEFKRINDTHGHHVGDQAIMAASDLLVASCRRTDRLVRYGGEEFVVIPSETSLTHAVALAERIRSAFVHHDWSTSGVGGSVTCSVGVAGGRSTDVNRIFQVADKRMYAAKRAGRNAVVSAQDHLDV